MGFERTNSESVQLSTHTPHSATLPAFAKIAPTEHSARESPMTEVRAMSQVEASGIVEAGRRELFYYADWCYNVPEWFAPVRKTRILQLPDSAGLGKVTHYTGRLLGRDMEWQAQSVEWKEDEIWMMRASQGMPAKMNMQIRFRFETVETGKTKVTCWVGYHAPYSLLGAVIDRFYLRKEAVRLANLAIKGMQRIAEQHRVQPVDLEFEKRKADHPGYGIGTLETRTSARAGERNGE